jgi:hypothetical protein
MVADSRGLHIGIPLLACKLLEGFSAFPRSIPALTSLLAAPFRRSPETLRSSLPVPVTSRPKRPLHGTVPVVDFSCRTFIDSLDASSSMQYACTVDQDKRGLRFAFSAVAEIAPGNSPAAFVPAQVTELSLRGCFLETSASFELQHPVLLKIHHSGEHFEAEASVLYLNPSGLGLVFREIKPHFREVLQKWVLAALDIQSEGSQSPA